MALWHEDDAYMKLMARRALGQEPQMDQIRQLKTLFDSLYFPGIKVLDAGCGCGHFFPALICDGMSYTGIDVTERYIEFAAKNFKHYKQASFLIADVESLGFAWNTFDLTICYQVLPFLSDYKRALTDLIYTTKKTIILRLLIGEQTQITKRYINRYANDKFMYYNIYSRKEIEAFVRNFGVKSVDFLGDEWTYRAAYKDEWTTYTYGDKQINGNIVLPWQIMIISK